MSDHQADTGQVVRAQQGEPGSDEGVALQGGRAGGVEATQDIGDHAGAGGVDERQASHVDGDVTVQADRFGQRQGQRFFRLVVDLPGQADAGRGVLAANPQQRVGVVGRRRDRAGVEGRD